MGKAATISTKGLKELQAAMRAGHSALDSAALKPMLMEALRPIYDQALANLRAIPGIVLGGPLRLKNQKHIEEATLLTEGKSERTASAWTKTARKFAPQGMWLEYGHRVVGHRPQRTDTGKVVVPRPWFRPAVVEKRKVTRRMIRIGLQALLAKTLPGVPGDATD